MPKVLSPRLPLPPPRSGMVNRLVKAPDRGGGRERGRGRRGAGGGAPTGPLTQLAKRIRVCTQCPLHQSRTLAVPGEGKPTAKVMIIGEAPGKKEDETGQPFVGNAGRYLDHVLEGTPFTRADFFITNIVKCRPPSNRPPKTPEMETCTSLYLSGQIKLLNPALILLLGSVAVKKMLGLKSVEEARGRVIKRENRKYLASYHPAVRFYREDLAQKIKEDFALLKRELQTLMRE